MPGIQCPKCHGTGVINLPQRHAFRMASLEWARNLQGKVAQEKGRAPGVVMAGLQPGGWGCLQIIYKTYFRPEFSNGVGIMINGKKYVYYLVHWSSRDRVKEVSVTDAVIARMKGDDISNLIGILQSMEVNF